MVPLVPMLDKDFSQGNSLLNFALLLTLAWLETFFNVVQTHIRLQSSSAIGRIVSPFNFSIEIKYLQESFL